MTNVAAILTVQPYHANPSVNQTLVNGAIESAIGHSRSLAGFLGSKERAHDPNFTSFYPKWEGQRFKSITKKVYKASSAFAAHVGSDSIRDDQHPGVWPISELATVLVGGLAQFVIDYEANCSDAIPFAPSPNQTLGNLLFHGIDRRRLPISKNKVVNQLTHDLRAFIDNEQHLGR